MALPILDTGINLIAAVGLGAAIGFERQWRQRLAGLRTNTLVALGAATFILFAHLAGDRDSAARVGAQVVSGIGFLGAGVIFKEGLNIRGLNTAATLWCAAAVGLLAGTGFILYGALCAALVIGSNVVLRPLVRFINRQPNSLSNRSSGASPRNAAFRAPAGENTRNPSERHAGKMASRKTAL
jgi:putative Mg2+ transporter-C (MgtC) family protein